MIKKIQLSVIIPFYNEMHSLSRLNVELTETLIKMRIPAEIIYVDDGSTDGSGEELSKIIKRQKIKTSIVTFWRNFGQTAATVAGIKHAKGAYIAFLDADLQSDPQDLQRLYKKIISGYDVVFGWRKNRKDTFGRSFASHIANAIVRYLFGVPLHDLGCSLKMYRRETLEGLTFYGETHRIMSVITYWRGVVFAELPVNHRLRRFGHSKYGYSRIIKLTLDLLTISFLNSYGTKPAYLFGGAGLLSNAAGFFCLMIVAYHKLVQGVYVHRDPLFLIAIFFILLGTQFIFMGLMTELLVRTYFESQGKTPYDIKQIATS